MVREAVRNAVPAHRKTVRQYVERRKRELGLAEHETFVPQSYRWGVEAQVDWYEAYADLNGERVKPQVFSMRSMATERPSIGRIVDASVVLIPEHSEATQLPSVPRSTAYTGVIQ